MGSKTLRLQGLCKVAQRGRPLVVVLAILIASIITTGFIWNHKRITIEVDGKTLSLTTTASVVGDALEDAGVKLGEGDRVTPLVDQAVRKGMTIAVKRAVPVSLVLAGVKREIRTTSDTVSGMLADAGITLNPKDRVSVSLDQAITAGMTVKVVRVTEQTVKKRVVVPYKTVRKPDAHLDKGRTRVLSKGVEGIREDVVTVTYEDGKPVDRKVVSSKAIVPAVNEVIAVGTRNPLRTLVTSRGTYRYRDSHTMLATAYEAGPRSCGAHADGYTAIGVKVQRGVVAVDPRVIPLKTRLYVEGYGPALAADVGAAIKGKRIDLFFPTVEECLRFGRRRVKVYILEDEHTGDKLRLQ